MPKYIVRIEVQKPQPNPTSAIDYTYDIPKADGQPFDTSTEFEELIGAFHGARTSAQQQGAHSKPVYNINALFVKVAP